MNVTLYQTLDDRNNPDEVENHGPYVCDRNDAWLGRGYYLWESHIELAHFWGIQYNKYIICKADAKIDEHCWDLHNNATSRNEFHQICVLLTKNGVVKKDTLLVSQIIEWFKKKGKFKYTSIRVLGTDSLRDTRDNKKFIKRLQFKKDSYQYFDLIPPIQICLINKNALSLQNFLIVYPSHYVDDVFA